MARRYRVPVGAQPLRMRWLLQLHRPLHTGQVHSCFFSTSRMFSPYRMNRQSPHNTPCNQCNSNVSKLTAELITQSVASLKAHTHTLASTHAYRGTGSLDAHVTSNVCIIAARYSVQGKQVCWLQRRCRAYVKFAGVKVCSAALPVSCCSKSKWCAFPTSSVCTDGMSCR